MADSQPFKSVTIYDGISTLQDGMHSGIVPILLEKTQASYLANITVRDGFATPRPPFTKNLTMVYPSEEVQTAVEQGLFQGCMAVPYQPDSGAPSQIASISGRLFQFQIVGDVVTVTEITIPGDPNSATSTQAWIWQAENFVIISDGSGSLPIFWDGSTSRRSDGPSVVLGKTVGGETIPAFGDSVSVALSSPYTGRFNVPVLIGGFYWQPIENADGYLVSATSLFDVAGTPIPAGTQVTAIPVIAFVLSAPVVLSGNFAVNETKIFPITTQFTGAINSQVIIFGRVWRVIAIGLNTITVRALAAGTYSSLTAGTKIQYSSSSAPNVIYGTVTFANTAPAIGGTISLRISNVYAGAAGQIVYIGGVGQYRITAVPPPPPGPGNIELININAPPGVVPVADILSVPELPACRMGAYGHGQNWVSLVDGISFIPSDSSGGPSGTPAYQYRDAVLKTTLLTFRGGNFRIPSAGDTITSMTFPAVLNRALGQGNLMIGTQRSIFSCTAPIDLSNITAILLSGTPIVTEALKGRGPLAQNSTINVNSDIQFRSTIGLGSLILAIQQFTQSLSGNTPISEEMIRVFRNDNQELLPYGSAINFDNRVLFTASPQASSQGVFHTSLVAMNLDGLSSLRAKTPAVYDGQWTGLNVLQLSQGIVAGVNRAFAFTFNVSLSKIEFYELLPWGNQHFDNGNTPITSIIETASLFNRDVKPENVFIQLKNGEMAVDQVVGTVRFQIFYKPDQYGGIGEQTCWVLWHDFTICATNASRPLYFPRLGFGEPQATNCNAPLDIPTRLGKTFQVRIVASGMYRLLSLRIAADTQPLPQWQSPTCNIEV